MSIRPRLTGPAADALPAGDTRIVITGAGGWIGRATLELLYNTLGAGDFAKRVIAFGSSARRIDFGASAIDQKPLAGIFALPQAPTLVLHLAFLTKDRVADMDEQDYRRANRAISQTVLDALDDIGATAVFVASSGAAEFADDGDAAPDLRLYGSLKKADEDAFAQWAEKLHGRRAVIARIFALSGPHINKHDTYALASFIADALAGRPITIRANFPVFRSYVAIRELMSLIFAAMLEEGSGVLCFSTGGERLEMRRVAETVSRAVGAVAIQRPPLKSGPVDEYVGDDSAYRKLLSRFGIEHRPFEQQVIETAASFARQPIAEKRKRYA